MIDVPTTYCIAFECVIFECVVGLGWFSVWGVDLKGVYTFISIMSFWTIFMWHIDVPTTWVIFDGCMLSAIIGDLVRCVDLKLFFIFTASYANYYFLISILQM